MAEEARQFNSFTRFKILAVKFFSNCSENFRNVLQIELKRLFFFQKLQKLSNGWGLCLQTLMVFSGWGLHLQTSHIPHAVCDALVSSPSLHL